MRLRQVALVAGELSPIRQQLFALLGLDQDYKDPGVGEFGLENSVMAIGDTYLEVVAPIADGTTASRLLERRGGNGGYMILVQTDDIASDNTRIEKLGVRKVWEVSLDDVIAFHLHPKDIGAAIVSIDQMIPPESWRWAGPEWEQRSAKNVNTIVAAELQSNNPHAMASRWAEVLGQPLSIVDDSYVLTFDDGALRFVLDTNGRGDGVSGIDFSTDNLQDVLANAKQLGLTVAGNKVTICGTDFRFITDHKNRED